MSQANVNTKVIVEAQVTRADGTMEDLGVISDVKELPDWFLKLKESVSYTQAAETGVIDNG